jgi:non-ribosomal peptide synthase protein (TIGR01720 family)
VNDVASTRTAAAGLSEEETTGLLQAVPSAYNTQINDVLLTALVAVVTRWSGSTSLLVDLEGHGREDLFDDVDLSRTVGWFTTSFPVRLYAVDLSRPGEALKSIKEQLRCIPQRGIGFGILRFLSPDDGTRRALAELPQPQIRFNYLGQLGGSGVHLDRARGAPAYDPNRGWRSPRQLRRHLLEVDVSVVDGRLDAKWMYSENRHSKVEVESLAVEFTGALRVIVDHCKDPSAGGYTPSDFTGARITQSDLDSLLRRIRAQRPDAPP